MSQLDKMTREDVLHHLANSVDGWSDEGAGLYFGSLRVQGDNLVIDVIDNDERERTWKLSICEVV